MLLMLQLAYIFCCFSTSALLGFALLFFFLLLFRPRDACGQQLSLSRADPRGVWECVCVCVISVVGYDAAVIDQVKPGQVGSAFVTRSSCSLWEGGGGHVVHTVKQGR